MPSGWKRGSAGQGQVAYEGDAAGRVVDAVAVAAAVAQDVPPLHLRERVLHAGADLLVDGVELDLPAEQLAAIAWTPVGHDDLPVSDVAAVSHHPGTTALTLHARVAVGGAVVVIARHWPPH